MRAIVLKDTEAAVDQELSVTGDEHKHLKVARCKSGEEILLLLGDGFVAKAQILQVAKTETRLQILFLEQQKRPYDIEVYIGLVKKEAMEEIAKLATELGVKQVTPLLTQYSQRPSNQFKRWDKIVEQAQQQSNNPYRPRLSPPIELDKFLESSNHLPAPCFLLSSLSDHVSLADKSSGELKAGLFIGPEGGFSLEEEKKVIKTFGAARIHLPTPILRAPTALATGLGHILSSLKFV